MTVLDFILKQQKDLEGFYAGKPCAQICFFKRSHIKHELEGTKQAEEMGEEDGVDTSIVWSRVYVDHRQAHIPEAKRAGTYSP